MKHTALAVTSLALVLVAATPARAQVIFSDNFKSGASPLWGNEIGNWTASGGVYFAQAPGNNPITYTSLPFTLGDFSFDEDINHLQDGGIWLHSTDPSHGILLVTGGHQGAGTGLYWHIINGNETNPPALNEVTGLFTPGVSNAHIHVVVIGDTYSAYVNGSTTPATTLTTSAFPSGRVALYDFSQQTVGNVVLSPVPEPSGLILTGLGAGGLGLWRRRKHARAAAA
jgi:hypothetical protein